jgi:hypothetical protein
VGEKSAVGMCGQADLRSEIFMSQEDIGEYLSVGCDLCQMLGSGSFCQRSFTSLRMTSLASVILEPFGPERASRAGPSTALRAGSAKGKNLSSCRALARSSYTDPLPKAWNGLTS